MVSVKNLKILLKFMSLKLMGEIGAEIYIWGVSILKRGIFSMNEENAY